MDCAIAAMVVDLTFSRSESEMEARVRNWGIAVRGGLPGAPIPDEGSRDPDLLDSEIIEGAMCGFRKSRKCVRDRDEILKSHRRRCLCGYCVMKYLYVRGRSDQEGANYFRRPEEWVQDRNREGLRWLINYFKLRNQKVAS